MEWHNNPIYKTEHCSNSCQNGQSILYQNKKSRSQNGFSPAPAPWRQSIRTSEKCNVLERNHGGRAYIKIINTRDTDERMITPEVEL